MKNKQIVTLLVVSIIIAVVLGMALTDAYVLRTRQERMQALRDRAIQRDVDTLVKVKTILSFINLALIISLLVVYFDLYRQIRSKFTGGLIILLFALLLYALTSNPLVHIAFGYVAFGLGPFVILPDIFTTLALIVLMYISLE